MFLFAVYCDAGESLFKKKTSKHIFTLVKLVEIIITLFVDSVGRF